MRASPSRATRVRSAAVTPGPITVEHAVDHVAPAPELVTLPCGRRAADAPGAPEVGLVAAVVRPAVDPRPRRRRRAPGWSSAIGNTTSPVDVKGPSARAGGITWKIGSTVFDHAPSSKIRPRKHADSSVSRTPGATSFSTSSMACSLIDCARRMHSCSSADLNSFSPASSAAAPLSSRPRSASRSGIVSSSTTSGPPGSTVEQPRAPLGPFDRQRGMHVVGGQLGRRTLGERGVQVRAGPVGGDDRDHALMRGPGVVGGLRDRAERVRDRALTEQHRRRRALLLQRGDDPAQPARAASG